MDVPGANVITTRYKVSRTVDSPCLSPRETKESAIGEYASRGIDLPEPELNLQSSLLPSLASSGF
jgi:hypothetical protein